jgi:hypothetical protein
MNEQPTPNAGQLSTPGGPRQFRIIDLFAVVTLAALLSAMAAPFIRAMTPAGRSQLATGLLLQLLVMAATMVFAAYGRSKLLKKSGQRIGIGYGGAVRWRHWPLLKSIMYTLILVAVQLSLALGYAWQAPDDGKHPPNP